MDSTKPGGHTQNDATVNRKRSLRILTESQLLDPAGGMEWSTLQNSLALVQRGHKIFLMYRDDGSLRPRFEEAGIELFGPVTFDFDVHRPWRGLTPFIRPARWARAQRPDVLWIHRFENIYWAKVVATWAQCPIVCHLHQMPSPLGLSILRRSVAHYVAVSEFMRDAWIEGGIDPARITVATNALPDGEFTHGGLSERTAARNKLGLPQDVFIVLCYGRMVEEKGIGTLLDAWARLSPDPDRALLLLVGSPSPRETPELARKLDALDPQSFQLFPMQSGIETFLYASDLVVFPTLLKEGFGRVVIEGMKTGRPVVASRIGAVPELLSGSMERFLFEPANVSELTAKISELFDWRQAEPELGVACTEWVERRFPFEPNVTTLERVLLDFARKSSR